MKANRPCGVLPEAAALLTGDPDRREEASVVIVCRGYCEYYRDGEDSAGCGGFAAAGGGISSGRIGLFHLSHLLDRAPGKARRTGWLVNELCRRCGFREGGCDFMAERPPADATPCGGYRLLQALLDSGSIGPETVRELAGAAERKKHGVE